MRVLVGCEWSGRVRDAFRARGHDAWSCDIEPTTQTGEYPQYHYQGDLAEVMAYGAWDLMIAFPPCTYLSTIGANWNRGAPWRLVEQERALSFVQTLMDAPIPRIAIENPKGVISTRIRKPDQYIQPYWFGDGFTKLTGLWLKNLPLLEPTNVVRTEGAWMTNKSQKLRGMTFRGIASAMADQWGQLPTM